ncbi:MAG: caspase family protein [Burkholderiales bacterium]|nr:caspase family protein [Burkholderiales bacterium]
MPATGNLRILCVHGVGHRDAALAWRDGWREDITAGLARWNPRADPEFSFVEYDQFFAASAITPAVVAESLLKLTTSGIAYGIGDALGRPRGRAPLSETVRWTAGMVAQWAADDEVRRSAERAVAAEIGRFDPHVICAHSLGSLLGYGALAAEPALARGRVLVTLGSQIGNPFVRSAFGGRIVAIGSARQWFHLFNREDGAFTAPIRLAAGNFEQVDAYFDIPGGLDHDAGEYLRHENTAVRVWQPIALPAPRTRGLTRTVEVWKSAAVRVRRPHRALLVGIDEYPDPANRLEGCVNDVYRMSEVLQELGLDPADIRVVLDDRATTKGVLERTAWLLDDARDGDVRVFFYSGHGAQLPDYGAEGEIDHKAECLVTYDFDWTPEHCITDDHFVELYSQLPYGMRFVGILDCCHSGGMTRDGVARVRGLNPPDDIRHRSLRWDASREMWIPRSLKLADANIVRTEADRRAFLGAEGATKRLGRGVGLWTDQRHFQRARATYGNHKGGYTPIMLQACREAELASEYRHGVTSYGAFTYSLTTIFRQLRRQTSLQQLLPLVARRLRELGYDQQPVLSGPKVQLRRSLLEFARPGARRGDSARSQGARTSTTAKRRQKKAA